MVIPLSKLHLTMPEEHALDIGPVVRVVMTVAERANPESQRTDGKGRYILTAPVGPRSVGGRLTLYDDEPLCPHPFKP